MRSWVVSCPRAVTPSGSSTTDAIRPSSEVALRTRSIPVSVETVPSREKGPSRTVASVWSRMDRSARSRRAAVTASARGTPWRTIRPSTRETSPDTEGSCPGPTSPSTERFAPRRPSASPGILLLMESGRTPKRSARGIPAPPKSSATVRTGSFNCAIWPERSRARDPSRSSPSRIPNRPKALSASRSKANSSGAFSNMGEACPRPNVRSPSDDPTKIHPPSGFCRAEARTLI